MFKESLPTFGGKILALFPEQMRGTYVYNAEHTDSLTISNKTFRHRYKADSAKYKTVFGNIKIDIYAKNYKFNLLVS